VIYSHDTYGLGHLTRSTRIARGVMEAFPDGSVLLLSGSPIAHRFSFPAGVDYVKLPSVVKAGPDTYVARELNISRRRIRQMRAQLILDAIALFRPHLLLVDNVPVGMKGELLPTLRWIKKHHPDTHIHLNLRDILDDPQTIRQAWGAAGIHAILRDLYDAIHVFGSQTIFDSRAAYDLPEEKTTFLNYIPPARDEESGAPPLPPAEPGRSRILVTAGGGEDGADILRCVTELQRSRGPDSPYQFHIVTGPLADPDTRPDLERALAGLTGITLHDYVERLPAWMGQCAVVLSMGGYNTLCEVMALGQRSLVIPRIHPRREQEIRARALENRGVLKVLHPENLNPGNLDTLLRESLAGETLVSSSGRPPLTGIQGFKQRLRDLLGTAPNASRRSRRRHVHSSGTQHTGAERKDSRQNEPQKPTARQIDTSTLGRGPHTPTNPSAPRLSPGLRIRRTGPGPILSGLLVMLSLALATAAGADLTPQRLAGTLAVGYDSNLLDASDAERRAFDDEDPDAFFVVDRMEDIFLSGAIEADWKLRRLLGWRSKLRARYERIQYLYNPIKSTDHYALALQTKPGRDTRIAVRVGHRPQIYGRHRRDKDALPGDPIYRAEVHRRWDLGAEWRQAVSQRWRLAAEVAGTLKDYGEAFEERDRRRVGFATEIDWLARRRVVLGLRGRLRRSWSRNEPDLGRDLSYREWGLEPRIRFTDLAAPSGVALISELEFSLGVSWRRYTSDSPEDWNHFRRKDRFGNLGVQLTRTVSNTTAFTISYIGRWRQAQLDSGQAIDYDEEGSFSESVIASSLTWHWQP
jgi:predicted glycosyltransferase